MKCPSCHFDNPQDFRYCGNCGNNFATHSVASFDGERRQATVLFSDLSGYTAMTAAMDPEEVKNLMSEIFAAAGAIVGKYEGTVERFFGDEIMALFGVPTGHEDDPVRAIRVAAEIHASMAEQSARLTERIGRPLAMHIGINTGLVITGDEYIDKGRHGLTGDAVNLAARLTKLSKPGETLVGPETYGQALHHFEFEALGPIEVKGKTDPIQVYKVLTPKEQPSTLHRNHGARADLIGRDKEMAALMETVERLNQGRGSIISVCGDAGTGKSRLTREFKDRLDLDKIQWFEGHAYGYTQNTPYYPLIDLLTHAFGIEEGDAPERVRQKIESGLANLLGADNQAAAYIGGLFSLSYPEASRISPEFWKSRLHASIKEIVAALAKQGPTVICFEDLHWADPSFIELLKALLKDLPHTVIFLCAYRPAFILFDGQNPERLDQDYQEIRLQELSALDAQAMLRSLLKSEDIPAELMDFVGNKAEGNPFYLEEVINSLIEAEILTPDNGSWQLTRAIGEADIPSSISGVLTARVDRLQKDAKRVLQEASVIGRAFFYQILKRITDLKVPIDDYLSGIEQLDLIRVRAFEPDLEYIFKHALTQEVVYNGILKKERQAIHERIGIAIETLFKDRLSEFYEMLAYHFKKGLSLDKAIHYLRKSGQKNFKRFAVEESNRYYQEAFELLVNKIDKKDADRESLVDLIFDWALVHYFRGDFRAMCTLLASHLTTAETLNDKFRLGMYYAWYGFSNVMELKQTECYGYLMKSLKIGQEIDNKRLIGYACAWLSFACVSCGRLAEGLANARRALEIAKELKNDLYLYYKPIAGFAFASQFTGHSKTCRELGQLALRLGHEQSNPRSMAIGYISFGTANLIAGDHPAAISDLRKAIDVAGDPFYKHWAAIFLAQGLLLNEEFEEAEEQLSEIYSLSLKLGWEESLGWLSQSLMAVVNIAKGNLRWGLETVKKQIPKAVALGLKPWAAMLEHVVGKVYLQMATGNGPRDFRLVMRNFCFLAKNLPFAGKKAEYHLKRAIEAAKEVEAMVILSQAYFDLALLYKAKKRVDEAKNCLFEAIRIFEQCSAEAYLNKAQEVLSSLD